MTSNHNISVIVATRNRPEKLKECLTSILNNPYKNFEIIVIDQSIDDLTKEIIKKFKSKKIKYFRMYNKGKSKALNYAITKAYGEILAFTDDDCLVEKKWFYSIDNAFKRHNQISAVFGRVVPYEPNNHGNLICICCTEFKKKTIFAKPKRKNRYIFLGNSMAIKKKVFDKIGNFKEWLGVGSISYATEDEDLSYRILKNEGSILLDPNIISYHNKWILKNQFRHLDMKYKSGFFTAFSYYSFQGDKIAQEYIIFFIRNSIRKWLIKFTNAIFGFHPKLALLTLIDLLELPLRCFYYIRAFILGYYFSIVEPCNFIEKKWS